ncbi:GSCFA family protein [Aquimixticola soesokkakensis]|uniref:GSCFA family protein n=1 Tax=Aquimixticola soesokkakensis TaxID=1519096 RepID=A0A1Y5RJR1_9RHOB|nr:GSCFA domain-containing protein [Aquimixticola soesokkakensis]SLN18951.1 GSCFA family protein [Aquimixticola soesokkakensis]
MTHPYIGLPTIAYWKTGVAALNPLQLSGLWQPKFPVTGEDRIVTAGSCFAQHIGRALSARGYRWLDAEPAPPFLKPEDASAYNYGIFSFRTGNIYSARILRQWLEMAFGAEVPACLNWETEGRFFDGLRPAIEPNGFETLGEMIASREACFAAIRKAVNQGSVFVFTLGLTESWYDAESDTEFALCPGTVAGTFDAQQHKFRNHRHAGILKDMKAAIKLIRRKNPEMRVLLTVSPVPLTATASGAHVLTATSRSKSTLRAVAAELAEDYDFVDYFPSYEIITHPVWRGMFYAPNQRSVVSEGVDVVMGHFFADQDRAYPDRAKPDQGGKGKAGADTKRAQNPDAGDVKCEEELLNAFAR